jgi:hypothetical protein
MWPASANSVSDPDQIPPMASMIMKPPISQKAIPRPLPSWA